jgi:rhodanese-related sulfurtransferase
METKVGFYTSHRVHNLTSKEAYALCQEGALLLDIREEYMNLYKRFGVKNEIQIPKSHLEQELNKLPKDKTIVVADASGIFSKDACLLLIANGFEKVENLAAGIIEWERDGMPLIFNNKEKLSGSCMCQLKPRS